MSTLMLQVKVRPQSRASSLVQLEGGTWLAQLKSPPVDGRANAELIALVAQRFACPKAAVTIKRGASGRLKWVVVAT